MSGRVNGYSDDRVCCENCGRRMVPRLITYRGEVLRTVCPFCAETYEDFTPEFPRVLIWIAGVCVVLYGLCSLFGIKS